MNDSYRKIYSWANRRQNPLTPNATSWSVRIPSLKWISLLYLPGQYSVFIVLDYRRDSELHPSGIVNQNQGCGLLGHLYNICTLLYGSKLWILYRAQGHCLETFHIRCLQGKLPRRIESHMSKSCREQTSIASRYSWCSDRSATSVTSLECRKNIFHDRFSVAILPLVDACWVGRKSDFICSPP